MSIYRQNPREEMKITLNDEELAVAVNEFLQVRGYAAHMEYFQVVFTGTWNDGGLKKVMATVEFVPLSMPEKKK